MTSFLFGMLIGFAIGGLVGWHAGFGSGCERTNEEWVQKPLPRKFSKLDRDQ